MPRRTQLFTFADTGGTTPWGPTNSNPAFPSGYTLAGDPARIFTNELGRFSGTGNVVFLDDTVLSGNIIAAEAVLATVGTESQCLYLCSPAGTGYQILINSTNIRCFAMTTFALQTQVGSSIAFVATTGHTARFERNNTTGLMTISTGADANNLVARGTITQANANTDWRAGSGIRGAGRIRSLTSDFTSAFSIDTLTDPLVPGAAVNGTETGFSDGAITANFGGLTIAGTVSGINITGPMSGFVDGGLCPLLPAAAVPGTFTQGANTASITRSITVPVVMVVPPGGGAAVPTQYRELRDGSDAPANFSGIVLGDSKYLGQAFVDAGNPLTTADRAYFDPAFGFKIYQDGKVELNGTDNATDPVPSLPYTTTLWIRRGADGRVYSHDLTISEAGAVVVTGGGLTMTGLTMSGLTMSGLTMSGM